MTDRYYVIKKEGRYYSGFCVLEEDINKANVFDSEDDAKIWAYFYNKTDFEIISVSRTTKEIKE